MPYHVETEQDGHLPSLSELGGRYALRMFDRAVGVAAVGYQIESDAVHAQVSWRADPDDPALTLAKDLAYGCAESMVRIAKVSDLTMMITVSKSYRCIAVSWGGVATSAVIPYGAAFASKSIQRAIRRCMRQVYHVEDTSWLSVPGIRSCVEPNCATQVATESDDPMDRNRGGFGDS